MLNSLNEENNGSLSTQNWPVLHWIWWFPTENDGWKREGRRAQITIFIEISGIREESFVFKSGLKWLTRIGEAPRKATDGLIALSNPCSFGSRVQKQNSLVSSNDLLQHWIAGNESKVGKNCSEWACLWLTSLIQYTVSEYIPTGIIKTVTCHHEPGFVGDYSIANLICYIY